MLGIIASTMQVELPTDPFGLASLPLFRPAARRRVTVFGAEAELVCLPERHRRTGAPGEDRPPFVENPAERILRAEALWRDSDCVLTANRFPLGERELLLWSDHRTREFEPALLGVALAIGERHGATVLGNTIGAAASISRAHLHLTLEQLPFWPGLSRQRTSIDVLADHRHVDVLRLVAPFPIVAIGVAGALPDRIAAVRTLLETCATPSFNLIQTNAETWVIPRRGAEVPAPHFPCALGAAELWGRWFYVEASAMHAATGRDLELAIGAAGFATSSR